MKISFHKKLVRALVLCLLGATLASAQQITLEVQPRAMRQNETATLKLNFINLNPPQAPDLPPMDGFDVQFVGQEQHFQITNNKQERRLTYNYALRPRATGTFQIGPFALDMNGQKIDIHPVSVEVLPPAAGAQSGGTSIDNLIFAKLIIPRPEVYLQERFDLELALYYQGIRIDRGVQLQNLPSTGLNIEAFDEVGANREVVNDQIYEVRRFRLRGTALTAGTFELAPSLRVNIFVQQERSRDPFFGDFDIFFGRHQTQAADVSVEPTQVTIKSLPTEGRPASFGGAVGRFDMEASIQPQEVAAGEPVTLMIRITGQGNFESISMPSLNPGDDFRRYDPKLIAAGGDHKVFEQVFIPRTDKIAEIPVVEFSYFDPASARYETITRGPYPLLVKAGSSAAAPQLVQAPTTPAADTSPLGIDIIDLKRTLISQPERPSDEVKINTPAYLAPLLAIAALFVFQRRRDSLRSDISRQRRSQAPRSARKAIAAAEIALKNSDAGVFHQSLWQALADYIAHRCNLEAGQISPDLMLQKSKAAGLPAPQQNALEQILRACDEARFAAGASSPAEWPSRLQSTQEVLKALERVRLS